MRRYERGRKRICFGYIMNELRITDCYISFKSDATTYDKVVDDFLKHCVAAGIDISINNMAVYDEKGNEIDE